MRIQFVFEENISENNPFLYFSLSFFSYRHRILRRGTWWGAWHSSRTGACLGCCTSRWSFCTCACGRRAGHSRPWGRCPTGRCWPPGSRRCWWGRRQSRQCSRWCGSPSPDAWCGCWRVFRREKIPKKSKQIDISYIRQLQPAGNKNIKISAALNTYSCNELRNTLDVYSRSKDVFDRLRATLLGLEKAKAVPSGDWESAPMAEKNEEWKAIQSQLGNKWIYMRRMYFPSPETI